MYFWAVDGVFESALEVWAPWRADLQVFGQLIYISERQRGEEELKE